MKTIQLKPKKEAAVLRFHPWIFSGAIGRQAEGLEDGDWVEVQSHDGRFLGAGHFQYGSISVRLLTFQKLDIEQGFWNRKIQDALQVRSVAGLEEGSPQGCYRLVHGEGDGLPGLIVDVYGSVAVIQCHSVGMHRDLAYIARALQKAYGDRLQAVYDKSVETLPAQYASRCQNAYIYGASTPGIVFENGLKFKVDWETGQKTGFFLDQRDNRALLARYAEGKEVLNAFSYTGGFSVYALAAGAQRVDSVDVSAKAIELAQENARLNGFGETQHQGIVSDVLTYLRQTEKTYSLMIVDPPAFAKNLDKRHNAVQGYIRLNAMALRKIAPGGVLFTFSCSQVVDRQLFRDSIVAAALDANRQVRVLHELTQGADHPVGLFHPEGSYLKGLVLYVD